MFLEIFLKEIYFGVAPHERCENGTKNLLLSNILKFSLKVVLLSATELNIKRVAKGEFLKNCPTSQIAFKRRNSSVTETPF